MVDDDVQALTFDALATPPDRQRIVLAVKRAHVRLPVSGVVADRGPAASVVVQAAQALSR